MFKHKSIVKFTKEELNSYVEDENAHVKCVKKTKHISIQPWCLQNVKESIERLLEMSTAKYDKSFDGILLSAKNIKVLSSLGALRGDNSQIHINVEADFYLFQPRVGSVLEGVVNKKTPNLLGVLVHKVFNVFIPRPHSEERWAGQQIAYGQTVKFKIIKLDFTGKLPYICGEIESEPEFEDMEYDSGISTSEDPKTVVSPQEESHSKIKSKKVKRSINETNPTSVKLEIKSEPDSDSVAEKKQRSRKKKDVGDELENNVYENNFDLPKTDKTSSKKKQKISTQVESENESGGTSLSFNDQVRQLMESKTKEIIGNKKKCKKSKHQNERSENNKIDTTDTLTKQKKFKKQHLTEELSTAVIKSEVMTGSDEDGSRKHGKNKGRMIEDSDMNERSHKSNKRKHLLENETLSGIKKPKIESFIDNAKIEIESSGSKHNRSSDQIPNEVEAKSPRKGQKSKLQPLTDKSDSKGDSDSFEEPQRKKHQKKHKNFRSSDKFEAEMASQRKCITKKLQQLTDEADTSMESSKKRHKKNRHNDDQSSDKFEADISSQRKNIANKLQQLTDEADTSIKSSKKKHKKNYDQSSDKVKAGVIYPTKSLKPLTDEHDIDILLPQSPMKRQIITETGASYEAHTSKERDIKKTLKEKHKETHQRSDGLTTSENSVATLPDFSKKKQKKKEKQVKEEPNLSDSKKMVTEKHKKNKKLSIDMNDDSDLAIAEAPQAKRKYANEEPLFDMRTPEEIIRDTLSETRKKLELSTTINREISSIKDHKKSKDKKHSIKKSMHPEEGQTNKELQVTEQTQSSDSKQSKIEKKKHKKNQNQSIDMNDNSDLAIAEVRQAKKEHMNKQPLNDMRTAEEIIRDTLSETRKKIELSTTINSEVSGIKDHKKNKDKKHSRKKSVSISSDSYLKVEEQNEYSLPDLVPNQIKKSSNVIASSLLEIKSYVIEPFESSANTAITYEVNTNKYKSPKKVRLDSESSNISELSGQQTFYRQLHSKSCLKLDEPANTDDTKIKENKKLTTDKETIHDHHLEADQNKIERKKIKKQHKSTENNKMDDVRTPDKSIVNKNKKDIDDPPETSEFLTPDLSSTLKRVKSKTSRRKSTHDLQSELLNKYLHTL